MRLASEIFQRCLAFRQTIYDTSTSCVIYDPCCGAAYHLSILAFLHGKSIREVIGSDIDEKAVSMAKQNLGLLSTAGLDQRISEISKMLEQYGKDSHSDALKSAHVLKDRIAARTQKYLLKTKVLHANATEGRIIRENIKPGLVDVIFTDVPYGQHSHWHNSSSKESPSQLWSMLDALLGVVSSSSIVAIASDKSQKAAHEGYERIEHFQVGKRRVVILKPIRITKLSSTSDG